MRSSDIWKELGVKLLGLERSQMRRFGHLLGIPLGRLPSEVFSGYDHLGEGLSEGPRIDWRDYICIGWSGSTLGYHQEELETVAGVEEA